MPQSVRCLCSHGQTAQTHSVMFLLETLQSATFPWVPGRRSACQPLPLLVHGCVRTRTPKRLGVLFLFSRVILVVGQYHSDLIVQGGATVGSQSFPWKIAQ